MRGDRPERPIFFAFARMFTPHARGSTRTRTTKKQKARVYPACAGIDHLLLPLIDAIYSLPRMRGDRPLHAVA